jgi:hypothetical protein
MRATENAAPPHPAPSPDAPDHSAPSPSRSSRLRRVAQEEFLLVVLLAAFATVFVTVFPPTLLVSDTWMTLLAGREVFEHGLPSHDELTVLGLGREWTDQQWGAQLVAYGAYSLGGHALLAVLTAALVVSALAIAVIGARRLGAGPRAILLVFFPVILAAPWVWTMRAQVFVLPLFTGLVWLLASEARSPTRRVWLALPILVVWANLHGSVALAALLTMLLGGIELVRSRGATWLRSVALLVLPLLAVLATPYGPLETARYYHLLLVDPPFPHELVTEWRRSDLGSDTVLFYALAVGALAVLVLGRRRVNAFDVAALALTFVGAVNAIRGIPWFALACLVLLPVAIGRTLEGKVARTPRRADAVLSYVAVGVAALAIGVALVRDDGWYTREWPNGSLAAVREATDGTSLRVFTDTKYGDWVLWNIPELRGRVSHDIRFEIYDPDTFLDIVRFRGKRGDDWKEVTEGFDVLVFRTGTPAESHVPDFLAEPGATKLYSDDQVTVIRRAPG